MHVLVTGMPIWISFKYVKLPEFCYGYGRPGHVLSSCDLYKVVDDESDLQYEDWLRGSPIKPRRRNAEALKQEKRQLSLAYRNGNTLGLSKKKLVFDGPHNKSTPSLTQERDSPRLDDMVVKDAQVPQPGNDASTRKLIYQGKAPSGEQKARLISDVEVSSEVLVLAEVARQACQEP